MAGSCLFLCLTILVLHNVQEFRELRECLLLSRDLHKRVAEGLGKPRRRRQRKLQRIERRRGAHRGRSGVHSTRRRRPGSNKLP